MLFVLTSLQGQDVHTPARDSEERKAIMAAIRPSCERDLGQKVIFQVEKLKVTEDWAYAAVTPLDPDGGKIDYSRTKFKEQQAAEMFEPTGEALLRLKGDGSWKVIKWRFGGTDSALPAWIKSEDAPESLDR